MSRFLSRFFLSKSLSKSSSARKREQRQARPFLESLEDRLLLASPVVTSTFDDPNQPIPGINTLRDAIGYANAHPGTTISFQDNLSGTINLGKALPDISANMTISGPGSNTIAISASAAQDSCRVFTIDPGVTASINYLEIGGNNNFSGNGAGILNKGTLSLSGDQISSSVTTGKGGGVFNSIGANLTLVGTNIENNRAGLGGGLYNFEGTVTISFGSIISNNNASQGGGGIYNFNLSSITSNGTEVNYNSDALVGAGIYNSGTFIMHGGSISNNKEQSNGGGVCNDGSMTLDTGVTLEGNSALAGGAIYNSGKLVLGSVSISNQNKAYMGGGIYECGGTAIMVGGEITNNTSTGNGGGIYTRLGSLTLQNVLVSYNNAVAGVATGGGGGIYMNGGKVTVSGGTIQHNSSGCRGGGIYVYLGTLKLTDDVSINDNNANKEGGGIYLGSGSTTTFDGVTVSGNQTNGSQTNTGWGVYQQTGANITPSPYSLTDEDDPQGEPVQGP